MKGLNLLVLVLFVLCGLGVVGTAFGAGGPVSDSNSLGGSFLLGIPGSYNNKSPQWTSGCSEADDYVNGSFSIRLDPNVTSFGSAWWDFHTDYYDTSRWTATCSLNGFLDDSEEWPQQQDWNQSIGQENLSIHAYLNFYCTEYSTGGGLGVLSEAAGPIDTTQAMGLYGNFSISPSELDGSYFSYNESMQNWYTYPDGYDQPPVIEQIPVWNARYTMNGRFVAPTLAEAQAMGAPYASVPEPSSIVMILGSLVAGFAVYLRRKR